MKKLGFLFVGLLISAHVSPAIASGLFAPLSPDSASTIPKGVRSFRLTGFGTQIGEKYDGFGSVVPLADKFNKGVTWRELIDSRPTTFERGQLKGGLQAEDIGLSEIAGEAHGDINTALTMTVPVLAYGITDKLTLGVGLPIVHSSLNVSTGWTISQGGQKRIDELMRKGYEAKILAVKSALNNVVATKIATYGYDPLVNEDHTDIGDLTVGLKWQFYSSDNLQVAVAPKLSLPTGRTADVNKVVDIAPGDGQVDTGLTLIGDYTLSSKWVVTAAAGYTYQWESTKAKRIPRTGDELISPDIDSNLREKFGNLMGSTASLKYRLNDLAFVTGGYSIQYKDSDKYLGGRYDASHYRYLEVDTWQFMQAAQLAVTATTVPLYRAGVVAVPLDVTLAFARVIDGRNAGKIDVAVLELASYF